jgi:outer membrane receptor protein involved in Fe transport
MNKYILTLTAFLCIAALSFAQTTPGVTSTIKGLVIDSANNQPLSYVTVALVDASTNQPEKSTFSKDDGTFVLSGLAQKSYKLALVNVGYAGKTIVLAEWKGVKDVGRLLIAPVSGQLKEVTVAAVRPLMKREVDRIAFDVQADPENKVLTVLDMMRKVPLLSVDATDQIKMQGNTNFKILINGKPSALVAKSPSDVFRSMPASNIEKIEVITTPPAKYDSEGLAGIINIITKKNIDQGYNGSVNTRYSNLWGPGVNVNLTVKKGKFGLAGYAGYNRRNRLTTGSSNLNENYKATGAPLSTLNQNGDRTTSGNNTYGSTELSYEADSLNLLTGSVEYYKGNNYTDANLFSNLQNFDNATFSNSYRSLNNNDNSYSGLSAGLDYQLGFKRSKEQTLTTSYKFNRSINDQFNDVGFYEKVNYIQNNYQQYNNSGSNEHTLQLDYVQPFKKLNFETGAKAIFRNNFSNSRNDIQDAVTNAYITDPNQNQVFDYQQNVYSIYNSYQYKFNDKWVAKGGLRLEHTTVNANTVVDQRYSNLVPSVSIQRSFKTSSLNLGYSDRIQRPGIWQLNPFVDSLNRNFISKGNPNLRPVVNHNVELTYSNFKKGSFNFSVNYKFANNTVESITFIDPATAISVSTYDNVGSNKRLGADLSINYPFTTKLNFNLNSQLVHVWLSGYVNGVLYNAKGYQGHSFSGLSYKFDSGYRLGANVDFDSRYVLLQGRDNYWLGYSASASKEFWDKKATISMYVSNPFQKFRTIDNTIRTPTSYQLTLNQMYARGFNISFNYKFGKLGGELKKSKRGISNDDVSGGGARN